MQFNEKFVEIVDYEKVKNIKLMKTFKNLIKKRNLLKKKLIKKEIAKNNLNYLIEPQ